MSTAFSTVAGVELVVGYCGQTTAKIGVVSLRGGTIAVSGIAGTVSVGAWSDMGADNSGESGKHVCSVALVEISDLSSFTVYSGSLSCDGVTIPFSLRTLPADDSTRYRYTMGTCENLVRVHYAGSQPYDIHKRMAQDDSEGRLLFHAQIDDVNYNYAMHPVNDSRTGLSTTGEPSNTGLAWDYAVSWCKWFGLIEQDNFSSVARHDSRLWLHRNLPLWVQWGDNDVDGNHCRQASNYSCRGVNGPGSIWVNAREAWDTFMAACQPPIDTADGGPATAANQEHWGAVVGPVRFAAFDCNLHSFPWDMANAGDTHTYGRPGSISGVASGETTISRTDMGWPLTDTQPNVFLGLDQIDDLLAYLDNDEPFKVMFASTGIARDNEPWADQWPDDWDEFCNRGQEVISNGRFAGDADGWTAVDAAVAVVNDVCSVTNSGAAAGYMYQAINVVIGEEYDYTVVSTDAQTRLRVGSGLSGVLYNDQMSSVLVGSGTATGSFTATATPVYVQIAVNSATAGQDCKVTRVSVRGPGGKSPGLMANTRTNGVDGQTVFLKGDTHSLRAMSYHANGIDGLGGDEIASGELWEINPGTTNGSPCHVNWQGLSLGQGGKLRVEQPVEGLYSTRVVGLCECVVYADQSPKEHEVRIWDLMRDSIFWRGYQQQGSGSNAMLQRTEWRGEVA